MLKVYKMSFVGGSFDALMIAKDARNSNDSISVPSLSGGAARPR